MGLRVRIRAWCRNLWASCERIKLKVLKRLTNEVLFKYLLYAYSREPAASEETTKSYYDSGRLHFTNHKIFLRNGGTYEESRVYWKNGRLLSLSQRATYEKDKEIRYVSWSALGRKKLDFASKNTVSLYFRYYPAYYNRNL